MEELKHPIFIVFAIVMIVVFWPFFSRERESSPDPARGMVPDRHFISPPGSEAQLEELRRHLKKNCRQCFNAATGGKQ